MPARHGHEAIARPSPVTDEAADAPSSINVHMIPRLGSRKLNSVMADDVYRVHEQIHSNTHKPAKLKP
jgi:hypothetical protein